MRTGNDRRIAAIRHVLQEAPEGASPDELAEAVLVAMISVRGTSPAGAAADAKRRRDLGGEIGALRDGDEALTGAPWYPPRVGDIVHVRISEGDGQRPAMGETYVVENSETQGGLVLRMLAATVPGEAGYYAPGIPGDPLMEMWMEAGPHQITIVRDGRVIHPPTPGEARGAGDDDQVATCRLCGCTDTTACEGGCSWVPNPLGADLCSACVETVAPLSDAERDLYRQRAHLIAYLAAAYPAVISRSDPDQPGWPVITVTTPCGQMTWHLHQDDVDLFEHVPVVPPKDAPAWDGHTTPEKHARLRRLTADLAQSRADALKTATGEITREAAAHVLWHYGEKARKPGSFTRTLIELIARAHPLSKAQLSEGFPGYVAAVELAQGPGGMERLRRIAAGEVVG